MSKSFDKLTELYNKYKKVAQSCGQLSVLTDEEFIRNIRKIMSLNTEYSEVILSNGITISNGVSKGIVNLQDNDKNFDDKAFYTILKEELNSSDTFQTQDLSLPFQIVAGKEKSDEYELRLENSEIKDRVNNIMEEVSNYLLSKKYPFKVPIEFFCHKNGHKIATINTLLELENFLNKNKHSCRKCGSIPIEHLTKKLEEYRMTVAL